LPEEFGWRGYVLDRLQERFGALRSSLLLGVVWAAWHLPLFLMEGTYQYLQGLGSLWFWLFLIGILPLTVVFTWVYNNTRRSTLAIVLLHFTVVLAADFLNVSAGTNILSTGLWIALAVIVCGVWGPETLRRPRTSARARGDAPAPLQG
jgi:membrane protease YdiL (CAAX protease family)